MTGAHEPAEPQALTDAQHAADQAFVVEQVRGFLREH